MCVEILNMATYLISAFKVATIGKSGETPLKKGKKGIWSGVVKTGDAGYELQLSALFDKKSTAYSTLLSYTVSHSITHIYNAPFWRFKENHMFGTKVIQSKSNTSKRINAVYMWHKTVIHEHLAG